MRSLPFWMSLRCREAARQTRALPIGLTSRRGRSRLPGRPSRGALVLVMLTLAVPVIVAANPADPTWCAGLYDEADTDQLMTQTMSPDGCIGPTVLIIACLLATTAVVSRRRPRRAAWGESHIQARAPPACLRAPACMSRGRFVCLFDPTRFVSFALPRRRFTSGRGDPIAPYRTTGASTAPAPSVLNRLCGVVPPRPHHMPESRRQLGGPAHRLTRRTRHEVGRNPTCGDQGRSRMTPVESFPSSRGPKRGLEDVALGLWSARLEGGARVTAAQGQGRLWASEASPKKRAPRAIRLFWTLRRRRMPASAGAREVAARPRPIDAPSRVDVPEIPLARVDRLGQRQDHRRGVIVARKCARTATRPVVAPAMCADGRALRGRETARYQLDSQRWTMRTSTGRSGYRDRGSSRNQMPTPQPLRWRCP
jgi:hypothetical protein